MINLMRNFAWTSLDMNVKKKCLAIIAIVINLIFYLLIHITRSIISKTIIFSKKTLFKTITLFCIPFYTLHTPTEPNRTTTICNCRSVAPGLIFGWTTQERQLKSCYLRRTKHCGSFRLNYHIFEHILYIYLIPENF